MTSGDSLSLLMLGTTLAFSRQGAGVSGYATSDRGVRYRPMKSKESKRRKALQKQSRRRNR